MYHKITFADYTCRQDDHMLSYRVQNNSMIKLRIRFGEGDSKLHLKVHYDEGYSEVWKFSKSVNRIRINKIVVPDFTDIEKLKNKIKMCLVFG